MKIVIIITAMLIRSCSPQTDAASVKDDPTSYHQQKNQPAKHEIYLNTISYFPNTQEFYVPLRLKDESGSDWEALTRKTDSVTFHDDETRRSRLPKHLAEKYFDMILLDTLEVFNVEHKRITGVKLNRVEYYESIMEDYFIAVFMSGEKFSSLPESLYSLSPINKLERKTSYNYINDARITERLIRGLNILPLNFWVAKHLQTHDRNLIFSIFAFEEKSGNVSYLTETKEGTTRMLFKQTNEYCFWDVLPIPLYQNEKPVLLITMAVPETDAALEYVPFAYNGRGYVPFRNNRIRLNK